MPALFKRSSATFIICIWLVAYSAKYFVQISMSWNESNIRPFPAHLLTGQNILGAKTIEWLLLGLRTRSLLTNLAKTWTRFPWKWFKSPRNPNQFAAKLKVRQKSNRKVFTRIITVEVPHTTVSALLKCKSSRSASAARWLSPSRWRRPLLLPWIRFFRSPIKAKRWCLSLKCHFLRIRTLSMVIQSLMQITMA